MDQKAKLQPGHQSGQDSPTKVDEVMDVSGVANELHKPGALRDGPAKVGGPVPGGDRPVRKT